MKSIEVSQRIFLSETQNAQEQLPICLKEFKLQLLLSLLKLPPQPQPPKTTEDLHLHLYLRTTATK